MSPRGWLYDPFGCHGGLEDRSNATNSGDLVSDDLDHGKATTVIATVAILLLRRPVHLSDHGGPFI